MKKETQRGALLGICLMLMSLLWTLAIQIVDVQAIGPLESTVGFAALNRFVHNLTGVHMYVYMLTDWLSLVPLGFVAGFALLGIVQWIRRKHLLKVDYDILVLGGFYVNVMAVYLFFETVAVNYRPVLINGVLEASYPSSTTVLVICVMQTAVMQIQSRVKNKALKGCITVLMTGFAAFMVIGRLVSGVHWLTDIVGGILLSEALVLLYRTVIHMRAY